MHRSKTISDSFFSLALTGLILSALAAQIIFTGIANFLGLV